MSSDDLDVDALSASGSAPAGADPALSARLLAATHASNDPDEMIEALAREVIGAGLFRSLTVAMVDPEASTVTVVANYSATRRVPHPDGGTDTRARGPVETSPLVILPGGVEVDEHLNGTAYGLDDDNIMAFTARTGEPQVIEGWSERFDRRITRREHRSNDVAYFVPLRRAGRVVAVLATGSLPDERELILRRIASLQGAFEQVAVGLELARLLRDARSRSLALGLANERLQRDVAEQRALADVRRNVWAMGGPDDLGNLLPPLCQAMRAVGLPVNGCSVNILDEHDERRVTIFGLPEGGEPSRESTHWEREDRNPTLRAVRSGSTQVRRLDQADEFAERDLVQRFAGHPVLTVVDVPFALGTFAVNSRQADAFSEADLRFLERLAAVVGEGYRRARDLEGRERSEERFRLLFESSNLPILAVSRADHRVEVANAAAHRLCDRTDLVGQPLAELLPHGDLARWQSLLDQGRFEADLRLQQPDGTPVDVAVSGASVEADGRSLTQLVAIDIRDRTRARALRQDLARRSLEVQTAERRRISRDLHDGVNQTLSAASVQLHMASLAGDADRDDARQALGEARQALGEARHYLEETIREVRRISRELHPTVLDDLGLEAALRSLARRSIPGPGLRVEVQVRGLDRLEAHIANGVYRIAQEALANAIRHAGARSITISAAPRRAMLELVVRDDGAGFDVAHATADPQGRIGLRSMRERALLMDAELRIDSRPGVGTTVRLRLPGPATIGA